MDGILSVHVTCKCEILYSASRNAANLCKSLECTYLIQVNVFKEIVQRL